MLRERHHDRRVSGRATGSFLFLLMLLAGLGAWNYHRNLQLEQQTEGVRPYESYATADIEALRDAYAAELTGSQARFESAKRKRARPQGDIGSISGNIEQFQQTATTSRRIRQAASQVAERQREIDELERELELRSQLGQGLMRHVKRLTTI